MEKKTQKKTTEDWVQGTTGAKIPETNRSASNAPGEEEIRAAFEREDRIPEGTGDLADRAYSEQESEINEKVARIREKARRP
jgi:hypothetical protein